MKRKILHSFTLRVTLLVALLMGGIFGVWADETTTIYKFSSKAWAASIDGVTTNNGWTSGKDGNQYTSGQGIQVTNGVSGANGTSPISFSNVSKIVVTYSTNASTGKGSIAVQVGNNNEKSNTITKTGGKDDRTTEFNYDTYESGKVKITVTCTENSIYVQSVAITCSSSSSSLTTSGLALANAPVSLSFDLYNNANAQTVSYTTSGTGTVSVSGGESYVTTSLDATNKTITVTPKAVTPSEQTITVSQAADDTYAAGSTTFTFTVTDSTPIPTHTATFNVNGVTSTDDVEEGAAITFPTDPANQEGKVFCGWTTSAITGTTNEAPTMVTSATMGNADVTYYAVFANKVVGTLVEVTDELTNANTINSTANSYSDWTTSDASLAAGYAGNSGGDHSSIQLHSNNNNSGIVTTTSGGKATKVTVEWNSNTGSERVLNIYGKGSKYSSAEDLYSGDDPIGTIDRNSTTFTLSYNYEYIGIRSKSGALYLDKVSITWSNGGTPDSYSDYCTTVVADTRDEAGISFTNESVTKETGDTYTGEVLNNPNSLTVSYSSSNEDVATVNATTGAVMIIGSGETTITASFAGNDDYKAGSASYTLIIKGDAVIVVQDETVTYGSTYTIDDDMIEGGDITVTSSNTAVATVSGLTITPVAVGTTTITVNTAANDTYKAGSETFTLTVTSPAGKTTAAGGDEFIKVTSTADITSGQYLIVYEEGSVAFNGGLETLDAASNTIDVTMDNNTIEANATTKAAAFTIDVTAGTIKSASGYYIGLTSNDNGLASNNETAYTNTISFTDENADIVSSGGAYLRYNSASNQERFRYYKSSSYTGQKAIQLYKQSAANLPVKLSETTGYATYCSEYPLDFSAAADYSAWEITNIEGTTITFNQITGSVKGGTGVFLKGDKGATVTLKSTDSSTELSNNLLEGILAPTYVDAGTYYGLKGNEFCPVNSGTIPAGKALLPASVIPNDAKAFTFRFLDPTTGITETQTVSAEEAKAIFNLAGQRLQKVQKGINIVNGQKVLVK